jgi:hypothetical protein
MRTIYVLNENKRKKTKTLEKLDNRDILLRQPTLITGRGIKFRPSLYKAHKSNTRHVANVGVKKNCRRQCLETRNFNLHTADEKVTVHVSELRSTVVIKHNFYNVTAMEGAGLVVFLPHYSSLSKHKPAIRPLPRLAAEKFSDLRHGSARKTRL